MRRAREHERKRLFTMLLFYPGRVPAEGGGAGYWKEGEEGRKAAGQMEEEEEEETADNTGESKEEVCV
ncbi:hypothetical protein Pcinc_022325 [Petrolisthes cinctipes]|uniref:Uncharacterized protein n=1 Tax=Petrolisthes cinctipes TaxID=88211 RepID=A0AAE1KDV5_PETCI|nr:hypothetical protein Pcinc_022325 [Petrolisthes cinctipes]